MLVVYDPVPVSTNPDTYKIKFTLKGDPKEVKAAQTNWIEVPEQDIENLDAWVVQGGALVLADLTPYMKSTISRVNAQIGEVRAKYITIAPGQEMIYMAKETEARTFLAQSPMPTDLTPYPFITQEIGITGVDAFQIAQIWVNMADQWRQIAASLENVRLLYVKYIEEATDLPTIEATEAAFMQILLTL